VSVPEMRAKKQNRQAVFHLARMPIRLQQPTREDQIIRNLFLSLARMPRRLRRRACLPKLRRRQVRSSERCGCAKVQGGKYPG
jgi:hypothetical protein